MVPCLGPAPSGVWGKGLVSSTHSTASFKTEARLGSSFLECFPALTIESSLWTFPDRAQQSDLTGLSCSDSSNLH